MCFKNCDTKGGNATDEKGHKGQQEAQLEVEKGHTVHTIATTLFRIN
jgi:hypothetical protein